MSSNLFARSRKGSHRGLALGAGLAVLAGGLVPHTAASANPGGTGLVINEVYGAGGNANAPLNADFVELLNPTTQPVDLLGKYVQYRSSTGTSAQIVALRGTVPAGGTFVVRMSTGPTGAAITPDQVASPSINIATGGGQVLLTDNGVPVSSTGNFAGREGIIDMVGLDGATSFEKASGPTATTALSAQRTAGADSDDNSADFTLGAPTPTTGGGGYTPVNAGSRTIAEIQGDDDTSPFLLDTVTTRGVVTAAYPTGGFSGFFIQTEGTGSGTDATAGSDGLFVFGGGAMAASNPTVGDFVEVTGAVAEFGGETQVAVGSSGVTKINDQAHTDPVPATVLPTTEASREAHEGEVYDPATGFTVTSTFQTGNFGEIGLATGDKPLIAPTEVARPGTAEAATIAADNAARGIVLDDGASANYNGGASGTPSPWITATRSVRVGAAAELHAPVILDFRNNVWKIQPQQQVSGLGESVATFTDTRPANAAPQPVGGDIQLATFNVLNYFPTTGEEFDALPNTTCSYFTDRSGARITVNSCTPDGPRGAATTASFGRQQAKTVTAINKLGAEIVGLEELENSAKFGKDRDFAISNLVGALNAATAPGTWAYVPSPAAADLPAVAQEDVIRTGFIYQPSAVRPVGTSKILIDEENFDNAREPLAQAFKRVGAPNTEAFAVIVNHFKSKSSGVDDGTGQGASNPDRIGQAHALAAFAESFATARGTEAVFLTGDFNSYTEEDPMHVLYDEGYEAVESDTPGEETYSFSGLVGSLDHVLGNDAAIAMVTGADVWNTNSGEPLAYQYGRYNNNITDFFDASTPFGASDHDPEIVGLDLAGTTEIQILGTNDFHGRLLNNTNGPFPNEAGAAVLSGAVKQLRGENPNTVFAAAGDLIGASTFESFILRDKPTIDALNEAGLEVSAVGNHEFDAGYDDLLNRVMAPYDPEDNPYGGAEWEYIGANVHKPSAPAEDILEPTYVKEMDGVQVGFIGAVTEHLHELVNPAGIEGVEIEDIVAATNREANALEAAGVDVIVLLVHEGAPGTDCATMDDDPTSDFGSIIHGVNVNVDAIVSGHTHLAYNCSFPVPGWAGRAVTNRPVVSAGQYGTRLNQLLFSVDPATGEIDAMTQNLLDLETSAGAAKYSADPAVADIVTKAVNDAAPLGAVELGKIAGPFYRGKLANGTAENRGTESTLGNLVAEVQRWATPATVGGAQIAFINPGGLRDDMIGTAGDFPRSLTYRQAANVQSFANTLVNMDLTGAQIKSVLEQQWQPAGASRPFLRLGASKGFTYTYDPTKAAGSRITGMWLHGEPIEPATKYSVTANSFLAGGGDNFTAFAGGTGRQDTGKVDLAAMVEYMDEFANAGEGDAPLAVDYSQRAVGVSFPAGATASYEAGDVVSFDLSSLSMSGPGDVTDAEVSVSWDGAVVDTAPVTTVLQSALPGFDEVGKAAVTFAVPAGTAPGTHWLTITGDKTGTTTRVPIEVVPTETAVAATSAGWAYGTDGAVEVTVTPGTATGKITILDGDVVLGTATLVDGSARVTIPGKALQSGSHTLDVRYDGDSTHAASNSTITVEVSEAVSTTDATATPREIKVKKGTATIAVRVTAAGVTPTGTVTAFLGGQQLGSPVTLNGGTATLVVGPFAAVGTKVVELRYSGDPGAVAASTDTVEIRVVKSR